MCIVLVPYLWDYSAAEHRRHLAQQQSAYVQSHFPSTTSACGALHVPLEHLDSAHPTTAANVRSALTGLPPRATSAHLRRYVAFVYDE
jgi:hypothetical protein